MSLDRFVSPNIHGYDAFDLGAEARDYLEQQAPDDTYRPAYVPCGAVHEGVSCILSRGHEGQHYWIDDDYHEYRWGP